MRCLDVSLRAVEPADLDFLYHMENLPDVWRIGWGDAPVSRHLLWEYIQQYRADIYTDRQLQLVVEVDAARVGTVEVTDYSPRHARAMVGIAIDPEHRGKGIGAEALRQVIEMCRSVYSMHQLAAMVPKDNEASLRLFASLGFKTGGCLRSWLQHRHQWTDVVLLQLML